MWHDGKHWTTVANSVVQSARLGRSTMEFASGIFLDRKFLYRCVHAAFVNTNLCREWSERTLFVDPIINEIWGPGMLTQMQGHAGVGVTMCSG